ncbi:hypothetical protein LCGC14_3133740, partial [marine sediment metagenome]
LRPQQQSFLNTYLETGNAATAYRKAGYVTERNGVELPWLQAKASQVLTSPSMQTALAVAVKDRDTQRQAREEISVDWVRDQHIMLKDKALASGNLLVATNNVIAIGKMNGAYTENLSITTEQRKEYDELERTEMKRISAHLLQKALPTPPDSDPD